MTTVSEALTTKISSAPQLESEAPPLSLLDAIEAVRQLDPEFAAPSEYESAGSIFMMREYGVINAIHPSAIQIAGLAFRCWERIQERGWSSAIEIPSEGESKWLAEVWPAGNKVQRAYAPNSAIALLAAYHAALELSKELEEEDA